MVNRLLFCCGLSLIVSCNCGSSDVNSTTLTLGRLDTIGLVIVAMSNEGIDCTKLHRIDDFIREADNAQMIIRDDIVTHKYENDVWGNPFHWRLQSNPDATMVFVISNGADGVPQNGEGDDLSLIVTIPRRGQPNVQIMKPRTWLSQ